MISGLIGAILAARDDGSHHPADDILRTLVKNMARMRSSIPCVASDFMERAVRKSLTAALILSRSLIINPLTKTGD